MRLTQSLASAGALLVHVAHGFSTTGHRAFRPAVPVSKMSMKATAEQKLGISTSEKATAKVIDTVDAPIDEVWALMKDFDKMNDWWPIYTDFSATGSNLGDTRTFGFKSNPLVVTEKLVFNGEYKDGYAITYSCESMKNGPPYESILTNIVLAPNGDATDISWRSWTDSPAVGMLVNSQESGYQDGIDHVRNALNPPALGVVGIDVISGKNLGSGRFEKARASIIVPGAKPVTIKSKERGSDPDFNTDPVALDITKKGSKIQINVFMDKVGVDEMVGIAEIDVYSELVNGERITKELPLVGTSGESTITVEFELTLPGEGERIPPNALQQKAIQIKSYLEMLDVVKQRAVAIQKYAAMPDTEIWEYSRVFGLPKCVKGLPSSEVLTPSKVGTMTEALTEYAFTQFKFQERMMPAMGTYDQFSAYFAPEGEGYVPTPDILEDNLWATDDEFLRQVFSGLNPMQVQVCTSTEGLPKQFSGLKSKDGKSVDELIADDRLYILDYTEIRHMDLNLNGNTLYAPTMLFYRTGDEKLDVLGIVLEPDKADATVFTPDSSTPNKYLFAKIHVQCADNQVHQFPYHLGYAHLGVEPMVVSAHNTLGKADHPLHKFLKPHFRGTVGINYLARQTLVADPAEGAITDKTFALGTLQGVELTVDKFKSYNFMEMGLPFELKRRGFDRTDGFKGYRFRDDGWLIWDTLWTYCKDMVNALYDTDADVAADTVLQEWAVEGSSPDKADIHGFPTEFTDKTVLTMALTTAIWCSSALHSALNYDQYPYTATPINRPATMFKPMPDTPGDITEEYIISAVPGSVNPESLYIAHFQGMMSWFLASPEPPTLSEVSSRIPTKNNPMDLIEFRSEYIDVYNNFDNNLAEVEKMIDERNEGLTIPYTVLRPSQVAASINI